MKKGIVRVPEWVKNIPNDVEFQSSVIAKNGYRYLVNQWVKELDGKTAEYVDDSWTYNPGKTNYHPIPPEWIEPIEEPIDPRRLKDGCQLIYDPLGNGGYLVEFAKRDSDYPETLLYTWKRSVNEVAFKAEDCRFPEGTNPEDWYK